MADIQVANTDSDLSGNTVVTEENAYTITGLHTFSRSTNAPFAVVSGAAVVANLDADKLDGQTGSYYLDPGNLSSAVSVSKGGTGATSLTDGGVLLGSGTGAITATAVLGDGVILIGDASGDPATLDVGSSSGITILGTVATGVWNGTAVTAAYGGTGATSLTDGGVLLGSGTGAVTAMSVLADSEMIVGDGSTDPVAESGATLRTSIGVGTGDSPQFTGLTVSGTGASALDVGGGINVGTGNVALVGTDGKINGPLSSTIIDDLSGANLTTLNASNVSSGTLANARLPTNIDVGGTLDVTGTGTMDGKLLVGGSSAPTDAALNIFSNGTGAEFIRMQSDSPEDVGPRIMFNHNSASPAVNDLVGQFDFYGDDAGGTSRLLCRIDMKFDDPTTGSTDSSMVFKTSNNSSGGANSTASLTAAGVWTDASDEAGKDYLGSITDRGSTGTVLDRIARLETGCYCAVDLPEGKTPPEYHAGPTAQQMWAEFGLGQDPETHDPGLAPKDLAAVALAGLQEVITQNKQLIARIEDLEAAADSS